MGILFVGMALFEPYNTEESFRHEAPERVARDHLTLSARLGYAILLRAGYATVDRDGAPDAPPKLAPKDHPELQCLHAFPPFVVPGGEQIDLRALAIALAAAEKYNRPPLHRQLEAWVAERMLRYQGKLADFSFGLAQIRPATARGLLQEELGSFELSDRDLLGLLMNNCQNIRLAAQYVAALCRQFASAQSVDEIIAQVARTYSGAVTPAIHGLRYVDAVTGAYHLWVGTQSAGGMALDASAQGEAPACVPFGIGVVPAAPESMGVLRSTPPATPTKWEERAAGAAVSLSFWHNDPGPKAYVARLAAQRRDWLVSQLLAMGYTRDRIAITDLRAPKSKYCKSSGSWAEIAAPQDMSAATPSPKETHTAPLARPPSIMGQPSEKAEPQGHPLEEPLQGAGSQHQFELLFDAGASVLKPAMIQQLGGVVQQMREQPTWRVHLVGHTDSQEVSPRAAVHLSQRRAEAVRNYLVAQGVPVDRLFATGHGFSQPVAPNTTPQGRAQNRRVELSLHPSP